MKKRILIIGQCTLHWGRMEFGNIGNYYIVEPMFREIRRAFPEETIVTTMQFSDSFCEEFKINTLPMELYYDFEQNNNLEIAKAEYDSVCGKSDFESCYIDEVKAADLVIDFSGDIWGDNADFLGKDRFMTGLYKDLTAQKLKKTVMICGSPGPFNEQKDIELVKKVFKGFDLVINREYESTRLLQDAGFDISDVVNYACPSFLFEQASMADVMKEVEEKKLFEKDRIKVGMMLCGWNFEKGPYDLWPREDWEYEKFIRVVKKLSEKKEIDIYLLSHSNGFIPNQKPFVLRHGRDFGIMEQLKHLCDKNGLSNQVKLLSGVYTPAITKGIISNFDMLISGRMHGAVAGLSQGIPTVILDYGHEPKAHKLRGFAEIAGVQDYIADPGDLKDMLNKIEACLKNREALHQMLSENMKKVKKSSKEQFEKLKGYC